MISAPVFDMDTYSGFDISLMIRASALVWCLCAKFLLYIFFFHDDVISRYFFSYAALNAREHIELLAQILFHIPHKLRRLVIGRFRHTDDA